MSDDIFYPWAILGVEREASAEEIQKAYRRRASEVHPDHGAVDHAAMSRLNRAREALLNPPPDPLTEKAQFMIVGMLKTIIRETPPSIDLIKMIREAIHGQKRGCDEARLKTRSQMALVRERLRLLKGPPGNFIESALLKEIEQAEDLLSVMNADERVFDRALELLREYSYGTISAVLALGATIL